MNEQWWPPGERGIDLSRYQGLGIHAPDFKQVAASGVTWVVHKATEASGFLDAALDRNVKAALNDGGLASAVYGFNQPDLGPGDAVAEAKWLAKQHNRYVDFLRGRPWQDLEKSNGLTKSQLMAWWQTFVATMESETGMTPCVYSGTNFLHTRFDKQDLLDSGLDRCPLILAAYGPKKVQDPPAPWKQVDAWQFTGHGRVPGIVGDVDCDVAIRGFEDLQF